MIRPNTISINQNYQSHKDTWYLISLSLLLSFKNFSLTTLTAHSAGTFCLCAHSCRSFPKNPWKHYKKLTYTSTLFLIDSLLITSTPLYIGEDGNNFLFLVHKKPLMQILVFHVLYKKTPCKPSCCIFFTKKVTSL